MPRQVCAGCGDPFEGRPNRQYCSVSCRRSLEMKRRHWDRLTANAERLEGRAQLAEDQERRDQMLRQANRFRAMRPAAERP